MQIDDTFKPSSVNEGRLIVYEVVDDKGNVDKSEGELSFTFKGSGVEQLKQMVKEVTGLNDIIVCSRNPLNGNPYPLRLHLPPNNATMNLVVVPSTSKCKFNNDYHSLFSQLNTLQTACNWSTNACLMHFGSGKRFEVASERPESFATSFKCVHFL